MALEPVLFSGLVFVGVLLVFASMVVGQALDPVQARLQQIAVRPRTLEELELQRPLSERTIKPITVRSDGQANRTAVWPEAPAYRAKVVASFSYGDCDPRARSRISVFPGTGGEVSFDLDFKEID